MISVVLSQISVNKHEKITYFNECEQRVLMFTFVVNNHFSHK